MHPELQALFGDVQTLLAKEAKCYKLGDKRSIPQFNNLVAGFPCQDVSCYSPNSARDANRSCVADESLRTGSVLSTIRKLAEKYGPQGTEELEIMELESVVALAFLNKQGHSNLQEVRSSSSTATKSGSLASSSSSSNGSLAEAVNRKHYFFYLQKRGLPDGAGV